MRDAMEEIGEDREALLTEDWLRDQGFKSSQQERQTWKHWSLYLGWASGQKNACMEDLIVEVTMAWWHNHHGDPVGDTEAWNCWLRGMNNSLLHVRYIKTRGELLGLIEALTGRSWDRSLSYFGNLYHEGHRSWLEESAARTRSAEVAANPPDGEGP